MIVLTYDNKTMQDGVGAQIQRILSMYLLARVSNSLYIHTPILQAEHISDENMIREFNDLIQLPSNEIPPIHEIINLNALQIGKMDYIRSLDQYKDKNILLRITYGHSIIDRNPWILDNPFPTQFSWVDDKLNKTILIAVHIRRGDVSSIQNRDRYVSLDYYREIIRNLQDILSGMKYEIHVYSERSIRNEFQENDIFNSLFLHIDESPIEAFKAFVNADLLLAGYSSFSYVASFLRKKGITLHPPFHHSYSPKCICIKEPSDIQINKDLIRSIYI
jgi:hypothetical protein